MSYVNRFPMVTAAALMMDCSGGHVYSNLGALERAMTVIDHDHGAMLRAAEAELAKLTGEQIEWLALGGDASDEPASGCVDMAVLRTAEKVLEALYSL